MASLFNKDIKDLTGVGDRYAKLLNKLGVPTVGALLLFYPRDYEDFSNPSFIDSAPFDEKCCIKATVLSDVIENPIRKGMTVYTAEISDGFSFMNVSFFNNKFISNLLKKGKVFFFYGKISCRKSIKEMHSPEIRDPKYTLGLLPVYHATKAMPSWKIEKFVRSAINLLPKEVNDPIPQDIRKKYDLIDLGTAIRNIHFPKSKEKLSEAKRRLIFEELLVLQLGLASLKNTSTSLNSYKIDTDYLDEFQSLLPFSLTGAQKKTILECTSDMMNKSSPMNRLIQGDVGSGKTAVAAAVAFTAAKNSFQTAFMAPTEILAEQHYNWFKNVFHGTNIQVELITGSTKAKEKRSIKDALRCGNIDIIIGTHALISDDIEFWSLGLVITDEQHRFGVAQRAKLASKSSAPHVLVMSATPIPRTLALIIYSDLDISVLDEYPAGKQKIDTFLIDTRKRTRALNFIKKLVLQGRQAYIVCPLVEKNDSNLISAESYFNKVKDYDFKHLNVGLIHGKMKSDEKQQLMQEFSRGNIDVLISTTVIEVGIDVPNSVVMMIENAERFGLSQLHQLRGRVGRGEHKSYCILVSDAQNKEALRRFDTMSKTNDGFIISDEDLKLRGPGDFFGEKQHGLPELKIANMIKDIGILAETQAVAKDILLENPDLSSDKYRILRAETKRLFDSVGENGLN